MPDAFQPPNSWQELLDQVVACVNRGERAEARQLLRLGVRHFPREEQVWLWVARLAEDEGEQRAALEEAYAINPQSEQVRQDFAELGLPLPTLPLAATAPAFSSPALPSGPQYEVPPGYGAPSQPHGYPPQQAAYALSDRGSRPGCISALAILYILSALAVLAVIFLINGNREALGPELSQLIANLGPAFELLLIAGVVLGGISFLTGVGLWSGARWGWWLAAIATSEAVVSDVAELIFAGLEGPNALVGILIYGSIWLYLLSGGVLRFFRLDRFGFFKAFLFSLSGGVLLFVGGLYVVAGSLEALP